MKSQALVYCLICTFTNPVRLWVETIEALHLTPVRRVRCFQKEDMKSLSRSEMMSVGSPFSQYQLSKNRTASSLAVREVEVGMMRISDDRRSVMVRMQLYPWSRGRGPMKSIDTD